MTGWSVLAHVTSSGGGGGGGTEPWRVAALAAGVAVFAIAAWLWAQRRGPTWAPVAVGVLGLAVAGTGFVVPAKEDPKLYLTLLSPDPGATVKANEDVPIEVDVEGTKVASSASANDGAHLHLYVDGKLQSMPYGTKASVRVTPGDHVLRVELVDERHVAYDPPVEVEARVIATAGP
ncbi:MAG TPA: hypothetical protein VF230_18985 [Acidimicrobiales bacterium]